MLGAPNTNTLDVTGPLVIRVEGQLELRNLDVSFELCQFIMAPGSVIYLPGPDITGSHTATFTNCTFRSSGCEKMWQGLFCPMEADVTFENCKIQDAEFAVKIYGKMTLNAFHTEFSRNYIGIFVPPTLASTDFGLGSILNDCKFDGGLPLYSTYYGQLPLPRGNESHIGILVYNLVGYFPSYTPIGSSLTNNFINLPLGIVGINSVLDGIYNFNFENIHYSNNYPSKTGGIAILDQSLSTNSRLNVGDQNTAADIKENTFINCRYGVMSIGKCKPVIKYNHFIHTLANFQNLTSISVINCSVANPGGQYVGPIEIKNNTFTETQFYHIGAAAPFLSTAISVSNGTQLRQNMDISWNQMHNMRMGIYLNNIIGDQTDPDGLSIHDNQIQSTLSHLSIGFLNYFHYGIWANAISWASIGANDIYRSQSLSGASSNFESLMLGFNLKQIQNCRVNYNFVTNYGTGFRPLGNCIGTAFQCNQMTTCVQGFKMANAFMTAQGSSSQPSDNKWLGFPTPNANTFNRANGSSVTLIPWYHKDDINSSTLSNNFSPSPTPIPLINDIPFITGSTCYQNNLLSTEVISKIHDIVNGNLVYVENPLENETTAKEYAFKVIAGNAAIRALYPDLKNFYDQYILLNEGDFYQAEENISQGELEDALANLNLIVNPSVIEENKILTTSLAIEEMKDFNFSISESNNDKLNDIAWTDAWLGGSSVFNARHLLMQEVDDRENNLRVRINQSDKNTSTTLSVFPNPANNSITVFTDLNENSSNFIEISDLSGRVLQTQFLTNNTIDTGELMSGIYLLKLFKNNHFDSVIKIEIIH